MTDRQKEIAIAKRLGWQTFPYVLPGSDSLLCPPGARLHISEVKETPSYLTDRNAAQEIIEAFASSDDWQRFSEAVHWTWTLAKKPVKASSFIFVGLLATPREICAAACEVWGMEDE